MLLRNLLFLPSIELTSALLLWTLEPSVIRLGLPIQGSLLWCFWFVQCPTPAQQVLSFPSSHMPCFTQLPSQAAQMLRKTSQCHSRNFTLLNTAQNYFSSTLITMGYQDRVVSATWFHSRTQETRNTILELSLTFSLSLFSP